MLSVLRFTDSDYPFGILLKPLLDYVSTMLAIFAMTEDYFSQLNWCRIPAYWEKITDMLHGNYMFNHINLLYRVTGVILNKSGHEGTTGVWKRLYAKYSVSMKIQPNHILAVRKQSHTFLYNIKIQNKKFIYQFCTLRLWGTFHGIKEEFALVIMKLGVHLLNYSSLILVKTLL